MFDVSSAIIQIQQKIIEAQGSGNILKTCIPPLAGVFVGVLITGAKDFFTNKREKNKIRESIEIEFKQDVNFFRERIKFTYSTIEKLTEYYSSYSDENKIVPEIISAKPHKFIAFDKYCDDYYNFSDDVTKENLKYIMADNEQLNKTISVLNNYYLIFLQSNSNIIRDVEVLKSFNSYLKHLFEYLNCLVVLVCQIERTLNNNNKKYADVFSGEILEDEFDNVGIQKNKIDELKLSVDRTHGRNVYTASLNQLIN